MALGASEFTELVASTLRKIEPELYDNVTKRHPLLEFIRDENQASTGRALIVNLELAENSSTQWTDASGSFDTTPTGEILGAAEFDWSDPLVSSVRLTYKDLKMNQGPEQVVDLLRSHIRSMEKAHGKEIVNHMHDRVNDGLPPANTPFTLDQLVSDTAYDADPAGDGTVAEFKVGKIDSGTQTLWQAQRIEHPLDGSYSIRKAFRDVENEIYVNTDGNNAADAVVAGRDVFEEFVDSFDDKVVYDDDFEDGQTKFTQVRHGSLIVRLDPDCPAKRAYFLDTDTILIRSLAGTFMEAQDAQRVQGTLDWVHPVASILAAGVSERRANAVLLRPTTANGDA